MTGDPWATVLPRQVRARMPRVGDGVTDRINLLDAYLELAAVAYHRARFLGELLEQQWQSAQDGEPYPGEEDADATGLGGPPGTAGLIGFNYDSAVVGGGRGEGASLERVATSEQVRALVELEAKERDRAAKLIKDAVTMGATMQQIEVIRTYAGTIATALQTVVTELGMTLDDEPVLRAAQRAGLAARRQMGQDDGDPDVHIGPPLSPQERVAALRAALDRAEAEVARTAVEGG